MKVTEETTLFTKALTTMNKSIAANKSTPLYKQIIAAGEKLADGVTVGVAVYKDDPGNPFDYYSVRFEDGQLTLNGHGEEQHGVGWKVSHDYLEKLAENPNQYIKNPMKMDWDWLKDRLGM